MRVKVHKANDRHRPVYPGSAGGDLLSVCNKVQTFCLLFFLLFCTSAFAQSSLPRYPDSLFSAYYHRRVSQFAALPLTKGKVVFLGNSITDGGEWEELFQDPGVVNRGISGDVTIGVLNRLGQIINGKPSKLFLLIGINDLAGGSPPDSVFRRILRIVFLVHRYSPVTKVYVQSIFPVNSAPGRYPSYVNKGRQIRYINRRLRKNAQEAHFTYVDVYDALKNDSGALDLQYTNDGLHLLGSGYMVWKHVVYPYVYDLQSKPALIPRPRSLEWADGAFPVYQCHNIAISNDSLRSLGNEVKKILRDKGIVSRIESGSYGEDPLIELRTGDVSAPRNRQEAYSLTVERNKVVITGNTDHGVFNGIQTLRQLMRDGVLIDGCRIKDWPAFSWRGYMVDVGRNYQSMKQLKEQIAVMSHYKLNVFHLHLTENVAWRLQIKRYPQLTEAKYMTRNKGQYYTVEEMHDLIRYCRERYITLVPEIDMPGHSAAFKRAMGVDMQRDSGLKMVKNILREVDTTYDVPYIHIGADEVKITNKRFIPEVTGLIYKNGKQVIRWDYGGKYGDKTIRQTGVFGTIRDSARYIDSRHLYLNYMDPLAGVVEIFNKNLCDVKEGSKYLLGGEICVWNDDRVKEEKDILRMNPVYPAMVTFGERSWDGGGYENISATMGSDTSARFKAFKEFEGRLLDQKKEFFGNKPFPYVRQAHIQWKLFGPFDNKGNTAARFWPERKINTIADSTADTVVNGGTVWLYHFFSPRILGIWEHPKKNSTVYAYRKIYSPVDTLGYFWIGFSVPERAFPVYTPKLGQWDLQGSKLWINGKSIPPPAWTYPGRRGEAEIPLVDENYEYRKPTKVRLKKGWNTILVKVPATGFKGWRHRPKWIFTVVQVEKNEGRFKKKRTMTPTLTYKHNIYE